MEVKTSTKEKFHVIEVAAPHLSANLADELCNRLQQYLQDTIRNVVVNLKDVKSIDEDAAECLAKSQQAFYEKGASFVLCELTPKVEQFFDEKDLLEVLNVTPTESEAGDIVQLEEIERELLDEEEA
ncbi:MAG TPA: STAS domain-containing protein [Chitinophagaceae bacterium]|nr:STAS domain-containing protein [Chitinophagaceae bacterium]